MSIVKQIRESWEEWKKYKNKYGDFAEIKKLPVREWKGFKYIVNGKIDLRENRQNLSSSKFIESLTANLSKANTKVTILDLKFSKQKSMANKLEVSFNSPQCGWMSIGFDDGASEFHTTTAHAPHERALSELLEILTTLLDKDSTDEFTLKWNRNPEEFDFCFVRRGDDALLEIYQYPSERRDASEREMIFAHDGKIRDICEAFYETFAQLYADKNTDEFEFNWRQSFPLAEFQTFEDKLRSYGK